MSKTAATVACCLGTAVLVSCSGGQDAGFGLDTSSSPPQIGAIVVSFPAGATPAGFVSPGANTFTSVSVLDGSSGVPLGDASVSINGIPLSYRAATQDYEGDISLAPGDAVSLSVSVHGTSYTVSGRQFSSYPAISAPLSSATWLSTAANVMSWSGGGPVTSDSTYMPLVMDAAHPAGNSIWPAGNSGIFLPPGTTSTPVPAGSLTTGDRLVMIGISGAVPMKNAAAGSGLAIYGFSYVPINVVDKIPATLVSVSVTPGTAALATRGTRQLAATATYSDGSTRDLTSQASWRSSDASIAGVSASGLVTGVAGGSATVTASFEGMSDSTSLVVFAPNPSPAPPLRQAVAYQIDYAHSGRAAFGAALTFPAAAAWSVELHGSASYPLIADGKVFVTTSLARGSGGATSLYALDEQTGNVAWGPVAIPGTRHWSGHAYDHGTIFVVNYDGLLTSFDAATGTAGWSVQLPGQHAFSAPPTAVNGVVYLGGAGSGGTLYAVDESNGAVLWTAPAENGDQSSPAVSDDGVFVSYPCQVYKFAPYTGSVLWHDATGCSGGGGRTAAVAGGKVYVRDWTIGAQVKVLDAATGNALGSYAADPIPAIAGRYGVFLSSGTLTGVDLSTSNDLWSFTGDGGLDSAPIAVDQTVFVGSRSGLVYALDAATGSLLWTGDAGAAIAAPDEQNVVQPLTGLGAGEGYLVVPAGNRVTAWRIVAP